MVRYHFIPTLNTVKVTFGTDFAFVALGKTHTDLVSEFTEPTASAEQKANPWLNRFRFTSFIPLVKDEAEHPNAEESKRSTRLFLRSDDKEGQCLGCFLLARKLREEESIHDDPPTEPLHASGPFLAVFPTPERKIISIHKYEAMHCPLCETTFRATGVWHEAGIHYNGRTQEVVSPVLAPFFAGRYAEFTRFSSHRDSPYMGFWHWAVTDNQLSEFRPFRLPSFTDALDALDAVAAYQDDRQVRQLAYQVLSKLGPVLTEAHWSVTTRAALRAVILNTEWVGAERFVARFIFEMWDPQESDSMSRDLIQVVSQAAQGLPTLTGIEVRIARAITQITRYTTPSTSETFSRIVLAVCREHRIVAAGSLLKRILDATSGPDLLFSKTFAQMKIGKLYDEMSNEEKYDEIYALRTPIKPLAADRGLSQNDNSLARVGTFTNRPAFTTTATESGSYTDTGTIFQLKAELYMVELWKTERIVPDLPSLPSGGKLSGRMEVEVNVNVITHTQNNNALRTVSNDVLELIGSDEIALESTVTVYAFTTTSDLIDSKLQLYFVEPITRRFTDADVMDYGVVVFLQHIGCINCSDRERKFMQKAITTGYNIELERSRAAGQHDVTFERWMGTKSHTEKWKHAISLIPASLYLISPVEYLISHVSLWHAIDPQPPTPTLESLGIKQPTGSTLNALTAWAHQAWAQLDEAFNRTVRGPIVDLRVTLELIVTETILDLDTIELVSAIGELDYSLNPENWGNIRHEFVTTDIGSMKDDASQTATRQTLGPFFVNLPVLVGIFNDIFPDERILFDVQESRVRGLLQRVWDASQKRIFEHTIRQRVLGLSIAEMQRRNGGYKRFDYSTIGMLVSSIETPFTHELSNAMLGLGLGYIPDDAPQSHNEGKQTFKTRIENGIIDALM